ncbi:MAG: hypothetical protein CMF89_05110 [Candidatus Marinimicrobia bacterium]|nr:hypothetical protein [Candidatus Neomarinimicrobiota bacterium]|tara:strand:- start:3522 stop:5663 length:2142 start_codon:yes stop_codon:yes gene_type:complete
MKLNLQDYKNIVESLNEGIIILNKDNRILYANKYTQNLLSTNLKNLINIEFKSLFPKKSSKEVDNSINSKKSINDIEIYDKKNQKHFINISIEKVDISDDFYRLIIIDDITKIHTEEIKKSCIYKISEAIHDSDDLDTLYKEIHFILSTVTDVKNFYIALVDWETELITFPYFVDQYDKIPSPYKMKKGLTEYVLNSGQSLLLNKDIYKNLIKTHNIEPIGQSCFNWLGVPLKLANGKTIGMICVQNYTDDYIFNEEDKKILQYSSDQIAMAIKRKIDDIKIHKQAHYDDLTGLTNKALFHDRLDQAIHNAERKDEVLAILFIDLDNFKYVNDSMGHSTGDKLLKIIGNKLIESTRKSDTVSRWGGDEFCILLPNIKRLSGVYKLCDRILNTHLNNIIIEGQELHITASIGVSLFPQDGKNPDMLIKNADAAMYKSKELGKNQFHLYKPDMNEEVMERLNVETNLFRAIKNEEFQIVYQPQLSLKTNKIVGFEALVRWNQPDMGVLAPYKFIPIAEETNLIIPLGEWIIKKVCEQAKLWHDKGYNLKAGINISAKQFNQDKLVEIIQNTINDTSIKPSLIELELTESIIMKNVNRTLKICTELKKMGVSISVDDFGTGYSSLSYLKDFPIDKLKIDQSFISNLADHDGDDAKIANLVIDLGHKLGLEVVAEGVETQNQIDFLRKYACDEIQGFILSKPLEINEFENLINTHSN